MFSFVFEKNGSGTAYAHFSDNKVATCNPRKVMLCINRILVIPVAADDVLDGVLAA